MQRSARSLADGSPSGRRSAPCPTASRAGARAPAAPLRPEPDRESSVVTPLHPPLAVAGGSIAMERGCQQSGGTLAGRLPAAGDNAPPGDLTGEPTGEPTCI